MGVSNREVGASCSRGRGRGRGRGARTRTPSSSDRNPLPVSFGGDAMSSLCNTSNSRCSVVHDNIKLLSHNSDETSSQSSELQSQISTENGSIKSSCSVAYINDSVIAKEIGQSSRSSISSFRGSSDFESSLHEANISGCSLSSLSRSRVFPSTLTSDNRVKAINVIKTDRKLLSTSSHGAIYEPKPCIMAKKLPPAPQKVTVVVTTNIFPLDVENRIVYRYDVHMFSNRRHTSKKRFRDLCKGDRDEQVFSESTMRHHKCMLLLRRALEMYRLLNESGAYLYDLSSSLFTNEPLNKDELPELTIRYEQMTAELKYLMGEVDVTIEISPCADNAHTFNIADYRTSVTNDLSCQDHSLRQFFEIMTNTSALQKGTHYAFGSGKLFMLNGKEFGLPEKPLSECRTLVTGADKGVRFIEGGEAGVVPALILDCKKAAFFDSCSLTEMVKSILLRSDADAPLPKVYGHLFSEFQRKIGDVVRDLRLEHIDNTRQSFVASGLSDKPVEQIMMKVHKRRDAINMLEYYREQGIRLRSDLPAVRLTTPFGTTYFPIELLRVASRQRVPLSKQTAWQMKDVIKECATPPTVRFHEILKNLKALDLSDGARFNPFMAAFGVRVSLKPLKIKGHRRSAPTVRYLSSRHGSSKAEVDIRNANWRMADREYLIGAELNTWYILYDDDRDRAIIMTFKEALVYECRRRGIRATDPEVRCVPFEEIESFFKRIRKEHPKRRVFVMYVDGKDGNHDDLKLMEVLYRIITQHVRVIRAREAPRKPTVLENIINKINCKNFGQCYAVVPEQFSATKWISNGKTLIIGYDVCHPDPQPKHERRLKLPPTQPSVIGISFNGALCPETFIGDYAFQQPRQEQATSSILEERICWILGLFLKNRGSLPDTIIVTRDGVSEGQFKMVMEEEVEALRSGIRNFADSMRISNYSPPIVCIIACKRHNKRFAIDNGRGYENCLPLTVIDKDITRPDMTEFFMQAHKVIKGTGKLPAYSVPINEANLSMDEVQSLMLALCFTHQIVNQAISIPEPIYQADEWAKRGRNNFKAMMRRAGGRERLPMLSKEEVDWQKVTLKLCYMNSELQLTRINA